MKIGLIRHFEVIHSHKHFMTSEEFQEWANGYNTAEIRANIVNMDKTKWQSCYSSDLKRAVITAKAVYKNEIISTELLREIEISPVFNTKLRLPYILWLILGRSAWFFSHKSQGERHIDTKKRAHDFITYIIAKDNENVLIVSHGALMFYIRKELLKRGFKGPRFSKARNGYLYIFEK